MRVADRPIPPIVLHTDPALARWPVRPVIAVAGRRDIAVYDDAPVEVYDDPLLEYDMDTVAGFVDATCDWQGLELETGNPNEHLDFPAGHCTVQLSNRTGAWSRFNADGTQSVNGPGFELAVWAHERDTGVDSWLFRGTISRWDDLTADGTVEIEAFNAAATLAQPVGNFLPGVAGDTPGPRLAAIMAIAGRSSMPARLDAGTVTLTAQDTGRDPLAEMQAVAGSDAGALFADADGAVVYMARSWRNGRGDQPAVPVVSDNVCTAPIVVWDAVLSNSDDGQAQSVVLQNVAKLRAVAPAGGTPTGVVYSETDHQWTTQAEGDTVAAVIYNSRQTAPAAVDGFDLYIWDTTQTVWPAVRWRLLDLLRFIHDATAVDGIARLDINCQMVTINHDITPDGWIMHVATLPAQSWNTNLVWDPPGDPYVWDTAGAVWGF
jgi:hypothetical protein